MSLSVKLVDLYAHIATIWYVLATVFLFYFLLLFLLIPALLYLLICGVHFPMFQRYFLYRSLFILGIAMSSLVIMRFYITDGNSLPTFATSDNPTSKSKSFFTRTLTFLYLPVFNFLLLLYPLKLSFDWSMDAIPRITNLFDPRNALTFVFYTVAYKFVRLCLSNTVFREGTSDYRRKYENRSGVNGFTKMYKHYRTRKHVNRNFKSNNATSAALTGAECDHCDVRQYYEIYLISLSLLVLPFIPATNLFFYVGFVVAERILYIPSVGYCFFVAVTHDILEKRLNFKYFRVLFSLLIIVFSVKTFVRNKDWSDEESLYKSGVEINPPKGEYLMVLREDPTMRHDNTTRLLNLLQQAYSTKFRPFSYFFTLRSKISFNFHFN